MVAINRLSPAIPQIIKQLQSRNPGEAVALCDAEVKSFPSDYRIWSLRGIALDEMKSEKEALASYLRALELAPDYVPALQGAAKIEFATDDPRTDQLLTHILALNSSDETAHAMSSVRAFHRGDCTTAIDQFRLSGKRLSADREMLVEQVACLIKLQRFEEAIPVLQSILASGPDDARARFDLALCQFNVRHLDEALKTLTPLAQSPDADEDVLSLLADIYQSQGKATPAVEALRRAIALHPDHLAPYLRFASLANEAKSFDAGITMLNFGIEHVVNPAALYLARGVLYSQLYKYENAEEDFARANDLDPKLNLIHTAEGVMNSQQQNEESAVSKFRLAIKQHPTDALTHYLLAEAVSHRSPPDGSMEKKEELAEAVKAVELDPGMVAAQDLLAGIYLQVRQSDLAIKHSEAALAIDPKDQSALYHLIIALSKTDHKDRIPELVKQLSELHHAGEEKAPTDPSH